MSAGALRRGIGWTLVGVAVSAALAAVLFALLRPRVEAAARRRIEREARRLGLASTVGAVRLTPWLALQIDELRLQDAGRMRVSAHGVVVGPRLSWQGLLGRAARVELKDAAAELPGDVRLELAPSAWEVESRPAALHLSRLRRGERLALELDRRPEGLAVHAHAGGARLSDLVRVLVHGCPVASLGTADGELSATRDDAGSVHVVARARTAGAAMASFGADAPDADGCVPQGAPTDAEIEADALISPTEGWLRADPVRVVAGGAAAVGRLAVTGGTAAPQLDLAFDVPRVGLARLLATAGIGSASDDLGSASLTLHVSGPLRDPAALRVEQRLDFQPPAIPPPAIERLKQPFVHRVETPDGGTVEIRVGPDSPAFEPLADVPALFLRALLLAEDASFFAHHGLDLAELPAAIATDLARGGFARGGSTIPQQLAKNLFLSREKSLGRKLQEASLALLLDSTLGKRRELEIYLNVIEWGPGLYGLRQAARHYFGREPAELTPKQMAFLVSLIPAPVKYQRSFADGVPSPFFEGLMETLLAKLVSTGALSQTEYEAALAEPLDLRV